MSDNVYTQHLDVCDWCDMNPFDMCPVGVATLKQAAAEVMEPVREALRNERAKESSGAR